MPAIGTVTKQANGSYKGQLKTLTIRAEIDTDVVRPAIRQQRVACPKCRHYSDLLSPFRPRSRRG